MLTQNSVAGSPPRSTRTSPRRLAHLARLLIHALWMVVLVTNLVVPTVASMGVTVPPEPQPDVRVGDGELVSTAEYLIYLPLILESPEPSPGDGLFISWAQVIDGNDRSVLLHWRPTAASMTIAAAVDATRYAAERRQEGDTIWTEIGQASTAVGAAAMEAILDPDLMAQLGYDLRGDPSAPPLTAEEIYTRLTTDAEAAQLLSETYYQVGLATGRAFLDADAPPGVVLEYRIRELDDSGKEFIPASVPDEPADPPDNSPLREVWIGPDDLGQPASARPETAEERYSWMLAQEYRLWDGTVYLIWNTPEQGKGNSGDIDDGKNAMNLAGYRVYRAAHGSGDWQSVNPRKDQCVKTELCEMLLGVGPHDDSGPVPDHYFKENLHDVYADPDDVYGVWDYKVCAVDLLSNDVGCTPAVSVDVRELTPPRPVDDVEASVFADQSAITVTWTYSDVAELHAPLRFYVTRSPTLTESLDRWTPLADPATGHDYFTSASTGPVTFSITDTPPLDRIHWYRVQVRDDAGNWSPPGVPVKAARYTRQGPAFPYIPYDDEICENNPLPLTLTGLSPAIQVVTLYRSFDPAGPFDLVERFIASHGPAGAKVTISDDYVPPYPTVAYYRLQALDGHGNASVERSYCALLGDGPAIQPGPPSITSSTALVPEVGWFYTITPTGSLAGELPLDYDVTQPGPGGVFTTSTTTKGPVIDHFNSGAWIGILSAFDTGIADSITAWHRETNDFLDTDRQLTNLGPLKVAEWMTDDVTSEHYVQVTMEYDDSWSPPVAVFRRAANSAWMQVSGVQELQPHSYDDWSDPDPYKSYEYVALVLSPNSYELLGYWGPITLDALYDTPDVAKLSPGISWPSGLPDLCDQYTEPADTGPVSITLYNGWKITGVDYVTADDGDSDCPTNMQNFDLDHAYGSGTLTNGSGAWPVSFYDIAVTAGGAHTGGRIVTLIDQQIHPQGSFQLTVRDIEFTPSEANAEVEVMLPSNIKMEIPGFDRTHIAFGVFPEVTTGFKFNPLPMGAGATFVDTNLPWTLHANNARLDDAALDLGRVVTTSYRMDYTPKPTGPENNLGYMRPLYQSDDAVFWPSGLEGEFSTLESFSYRTVFPADIQVQFDGALLTVDNGQIVSGELYQAGAQLTYEQGGTVTDYVAFNAACDGSPQSHYSLCEGWRASYHENTLQMTPTNRDDAIYVGFGGYLSATVTLDTPVAWPSFAADPPNATLYVAPAAFPDTPTSWAPMPAENAWTRLPDPDTRGTLDPGINLNEDSDTIQYFFYDPPDLDAAFNFYVRKGGVSGHLIMTGSGPVTNDWGYSEEIQRIELIFVDNSVIPPLLDYETDLNLPYPSDVTLRLEVEQTDASNRPVSGVFRLPTTITHRYWGFTETPSTWVYGYANANEYTEAISENQPRILALLESQAPVAGLLADDAAPDAAPVELTFTTEWFPDGDIGVLRMMPPPGLSYRVGSFRFRLSSVKLSRYYSTPLDHGSLPSTLGIDLDDTMDTMPDALLDSGQLTGQSLKNCATTDIDNCGFVVLDGDVAVDYFGEIQVESVAGQSLHVDFPLVDNMLGEFPVAVNTAITVTKYLGVLSGFVPWIWPMVNRVLDVDLPVKFLGNTQGGVLVGLWRNAPVAPDSEIFKADVAGVVEIKWNLTTGFNDKVGVFLGYSASQAAFRALAMNRPNPAGGVIPYDNWIDVGTDIGIWAEKFGYAANGAGAQDSPVDLASDTWSNWCQAWSGNNCTSELDWAFAHSILQSRLEAMGGVDAYGVTSVKAGEALASSQVVMHTASLAAVLRREGRGLELTTLEGAAQVQWDIWDYSALYVWGVPLFYIDFFLRVDWLTLAMNRDGEIEMWGDTYVNLLYDLGVDGSIYALATPVGEEFRVEGTAELDTIGLAGVAGIDVNGVFGMGPYVVEETGDTEMVEYFGANIVGDFMGYTVGGGFLYGILPQESAILRQAGFGEVLDTLGDEPGYAGIYAYLFGDFPVAGDTCLMEVTAGGELRFWYFWSDEIWGGTLSGHVTASVLCLISGRGQLELGYGRLDNGGQMYNRTCNNSQCDVYGGSFWIAAGVGWCSPSTWRRWRDRWWGDDWCYTFGAYVDLSYFDPGGLDYSADFDYE